MKIRLFPALLLCLLLFYTLRAQVSPQEAIAVPKSNVEAQMLRRKQKTPRVSLKSLANFGNALLVKNGYEFTFDVQAGDVLVSNVEVDGNAPEVYKLTQVDGKTRLFATREHGSHPCGTWTGLTVSQLNVKEMTILANGKTYPVAIPKDLIFDEIALVDKSLKKTIRRWLTPLDATPEAISRDGKTLYINTEIEGIYLGISEAGNFSFVPADDRSIFKNGIELKKFPKDPDNDYLGYKTFGGNQKFFLKFSYPCT